MERNLRIKAKQRRDLVGNHLRGMIMAVVHQRQTAMGGGKTQSKLRRPCRIGFHADSKHLGLHAGLYQRLVIRL